MTIARQYRKAAPPVPMKAPPVKSSAYLDFVRRLPCVVTWANDVEAAHLSSRSPQWGHFGRGKGQKASDRWALPLNRAMHAEQHKGREMDFWAKHGIDPHRLACVLWGLWNERGEDSMPDCVKIIKALK